ncbi:MAG: hypothetical protein ACO3OO_01450 [Gemmobacter sp.]
MERRAEDVPWALEHMARPLRHMEAAPEAVGKGLFAALECAGMGSNDGWA